MMDVSDCSWSMRAVRWSWGGMRGDIHLNMPGSDSPWGTADAGCLSGRCGGESYSCSSAAAATVTLFAFDEGQSLSEHTAPFDARRARAGRGSPDHDCWVSCSTVPAGDIVLMPADQPHAVAARTRFKMLLTMIRPV